MSSNAAQTMPEATIVSRTKAAYDGFGGALWTLNHRIAPVWVLYGAIPWGSDLRKGERMVEGYTESWESGRVVLDLPVGMGRMFPHYVNRIKPQRVIAIDLSDGMVRRARRSAERAGFNGNGEFVAADVASIPLPDASVDYVLTEGGFHHFPDRDAAVSEFMRVLRPGGSLAGYALVDRENLRGSVSLRLCHRFSLMAEPISAARLRSVFLGHGAEDWRESKTGSLLCFAARKPEK
jgi:SAM-dependent methyltransferase